MFDRFSRTAYRGSALSCAQDPEALGLAVEGIDAGMNRELKFQGRVFFWMPLAQPEDLALQDRSARHAEDEAAYVPPHMRRLTL